MKWLSWLTGNSDTAEKVVDGVSNGLDAMFFTEEERSRASFEVLKLKVEFAKNTAFMSISRRIIVVTVCALWALLVLLLVIFGMWLGGEHTSVKFLFMVLKDIVNPPFMIIVGFYFLTHVVKGARGK